VRFNFTGNYWGAFKAFILWPLAGAATVGGLVPLAHRARDYYVINNRTFGGKHFATSFPGKSIYRIYGFALLLFAGMLLMVVPPVSVVLRIGVAVISGAGGAAQAPGALTPQQIRAIIAIPVIALTLAAYTAIITYVWTNVFNLAVNNTVLDGRHRLEAGLQPWPMFWIILSNLLLTLVTIGVFYPWARVRISHYMADHMNLLAASNLDEFTSEVFAAQSAIGEEVAGFFDFDIGL
jgi:uncharacterized membrane protein YjgN (DUF898 family)